MHPKFFALRKHKGEKVVCLINNRDLSVLALSILTLLHTPYQFEASFTVHSSPITARP